MKILIIDGHSEICELLSSELISAGHEVLFATSLDEGKKLFMGMRPHITFCGCRNDSGDSLEFLKAVCLCGSDNQIYMMSSYPPHSPGTYLLHGASGFIDKNEGFLQIFEIVSRHIPPIDEAS